MPRYDYRCSACRHVYEKREGFDALSVQECPDCLGVARRVLTPPALVFKGSGFYVTDSRSSSSATQPASSSKDSNKESKSEGSSPASTDSKSAEKESKSNASAPKSDKKESSASSQ